jgi:hypothetical protein
MTTTSGTTPERPTARGRGARTAAPEPDRVIGGRYRLLRRREGPGPHDAGELWQALDETLARPVAIRLLPARNRRASACLAAAGRAGRLADPRVARVLDAAKADGFAYVVTEWVDGDSLGGLLRAYGPIEPPRATAITLEVARAVAAAHAAGLKHGRLHPENVLVGADDVVKVTDLEVAAALTEPGTPEEDGHQRRDDPRRTDAHDLGRILYAALTARWPRSPEDDRSTTAGPATGHGLAAPPLGEGGRAATPRQIRAGIPRPVDSVVCRCLLPAASGDLDALTTPAAVVAALTALPRPQTDTDRDSLEPAAPSAGARRARRIAGIAVPLGVVAGIAALAWIAGLAVGRVPGPDRGFTAPNVPHGSTAPGTGTVIAVPAGRAHDFDPEGDGSENPEQAALALDGDLSTAWQTATYRNRPDFGGLKSGVGLLVDLGRPRTVRSVTVVLTVPGADVELRVGAAHAADVNGYQVVGRVTNAGRRPPHGEPAGTVTFTPGGASGAAPVTGRYWLVWFTRLPRSGSGYADGIAEITFRR